MAAAPMKVGKEEMMACLAALDYWSKADIAAINKEWQRLKTPSEPLGIGRPTTNQLRILPITMQPGEELIVGNSLRRVLDKARKQSA